MLVQSTDAIALVQRGAAREFAKTTNIRILEPPFEIPEVTMCAYWSAITRRIRRTPGSVHYCRTCRGRITEAVVA